MKIYSYFKKLSAILLTIIFLFSFVACSNEESDSANLGETTYSNKQNTEADELNNKKSQFWLPVTYKSYYTSGGLKYQTEWKYDESGFFKGNNKK